jgi:hypothetical protein
MQFSHQFIKSFVVNSPINFVPNSNRRRAAAVTQTEDGLERDQLVRTGFMKVAANSTRGMFFQFASPLGLTSFAAADLN